MNSTQFEESRTYPYQDNSKQILPKYKENLSSSNSNYQNSSPIKIQSNSSFSNINQPPPPQENDQLALLLKQKAELEAQIAALANQSTTQKQNQYQNQNQTNQTNQNQYQQSAPRQLCLDLTKDDYNTNNTKTTNPFTSTNPFSYNNSLNYNNNNQMTSSNTSSINISSSNPFNYNSESNLFGNGTNDGKPMYVSDFLTSANHNQSYVSSWNDHPSEIKERVLGDYNSVDLSNSDVGFGFNSAFSGNTFGSGGNNGGAGGGGFGGIIDDNAPLCNCGLNCVKLMSRTSANMNREFYKCASTNENERCSFFQWVDGGAWTANPPPAPDNSVVKDYIVANKRIFGHNKFREGQKECIEAALQGILSFLSILIMFYFYYYVFFSTIKYFINLQI